MPSVHELLPLKTALYQQTVQP